MELGDKGAVDDETPLVQRKRCMLCLQVDGQAGRREEVVELAMKAAKIGRTTVCKVQVRVLLN